LAIQCYVWARKRVYIVERILDRTHDPLDFPVTAVRRWRLSGQAATWCGYPASPVVLPFNSPPSAMIHSLHSLPYVSRRAVVAVLLVAVAFTARPQDANAQRWLQTTQVVAPVQAESATRALLDTLVNVIDRSDSLVVKRSPDAPTQMPVQELRDMLIETEGIGLSSANNVFIDYRFEVDRDGFKESVTDLYFIYRPPGAGEEDIPIMYLSARHDWVREVLQEKGTAMLTNEAAIRPFADQIAFAKITRGQEVQVVEVGNRTVREGFRTKERNLIERIMRLSYSSR